MREMLGSNIYFLIPLGILSLLALTLMLERTVTFLSLTSLRPSRIHEALDLLSDNFPDEARLKLKKNPSPQARLLVWAIDNRDLYGTESFAWKLESQAIRLMAPLGRGVPYLSLFANIATLMGLLGTVLGMIVAFYAMQQTGSSDPFVLAGGISQALISTAAGLLIAIPCLLMHSFFNSVIRRNREELEIMASDILSLRKERDG